MQGPGTPTHRYNGYRQINQSTLASSRGALGLRSVFYVLQRQQEASRVNTCGVFGVPNMNDK